MPISARRTIQKCTKQESAGQYVRRFSFGVVTGMALLIPVQARIKRIAHAIA